MTLRWLLHFTSVLVFWAATTNPLDVDFPNVAFLWAWIGFTAGVFGIFSISLAGCIFPSKTEQLAVCRMRRVFLAISMLIATVVLQQSYLQFKTCAVYAFQAQRAIGCFVVANCVAFGILIIAMAITVCIQDPEKGCHRMLGDDSNK